MAGSFDKKLLRWLLPVAVVILGVLLLQTAASQSTYQIRNISPQDGRA